jgi:hypothetical protein
MKAKDYVERMRQLLMEHEDDREAIAIVFRELILEFKTLAEVRHVQTDDAAIAIIKELDRKWRKICEMVPGLNPDGYKTFIAHELPDVYSYWLLTDAIRRRQ